MVVRLVQCAPGDEAHVDATRIGLQDELPAGCCAIELVEHPAEAIDAARHLTEQVLDVHEVEVDRCNRSVGIGRGDHGRVLRDRPLDQPAVEPHQVAHVEHVLEGRPARDVRAVAQPPAVARADEDGDVVGNVAERLGHRRQRHRPTVETALHAVIDHDVPSTSGRSSVVPGQRICRAPLESLRSYSRVLDRRANGATHSCESTTSPSYSRTLLAMRDVGPVGDRPNVRVPKTAELVADHIRRQVVTHRLHDGDALPTETSLMEQFGISRPTLREAFRILESEGLITVRRGARGGARIQEPSADVAAVYAGLVLQHRNTTVADVLTARTVVEAPAARLLAERPDRRPIVERLQHERDATPPDPDRFDRFNQVVIELTENQTLILISSIIAGITRAAALRYSTDDEHVDRLVQRAMNGRQRLIDLIGAGDGDGAEDLWRLYLTEAGEVLAAGTGGTVVDLFS